MVYPIAPRLQTCTACYCTGYCSQSEHNVKYYNLMGPPSYIQSAVDRNVVMRQMTVLPCGFVEITRDTNSTNHFLCTFIYIIHMTYKTAHSPLLTIIYAKRNTQHTPRYTINHLKHYFSYTYHDCGTTTKGNGCSPAALCRNAYGYVQNTFRNNAYMVKRAVVCILP